MVECWAAGQNCIKCIIYAQSNSSKKGDLCSEIAKVSILLVLCAVARGVMEKEITIPKSSTTHALVNMTQNWLVNTDGNDATARVVLLDFRKAFDLIDCSVLIQKLTTYDIPS